MSSFNSRAAENRSHFLQRCCWALLGLSLLAGGAGYFGDGRVAAVSSQTAGSTIRYDRFLRRQSASRILLTLDAATTPLILALPVDTVQILRIVPSSGVQRAADGAVSFGRQSAGLVEVVFEPLEVGWLRLSIKDDAQAVSLQTFVFP